MYQQMGSIKSILHSFVIMFVMMKLNGINKKLKLLEHGTFKQKKSCV